MNAAEADGGPNAIEFLIPGAGPHIIQPNSSFPVINDTTFVDGWSQGAAAMPDTVSRLMGRIL